jgi:hypothetical protein
VPELGLYQLPQLVGLVRPHLPVIEGSALARRRPSISGRFVARPPTTSQSLTMPNTLRLAMTGLLLAMALSGCPAFPFIPALPDVGPPPERRDSGYPLACLGRTDAIDGESVAEADAILSASFEEGTTRVPLSRNGCITFERVVEDGRLISARIERVIGTTEGSDFSFEVVTIARWERDADGSLRGGIDADEDDDDASDDFFEIQELADEATGRWERTAYDPSSRAVVSRVTLTREADGSLTQRHEALRDGSLVVTSEGAVELRTQSDLLDDLLDPSCSRRDCSESELARIERLSREALAQGVDCLTQGGQDRGNARATGLQELWVRWRGAHRFRCISHCNHAGQFDLGALAGSGPLSMELDTSLDDDELRSTISHEWTHGYRGGHADDVLDLIDRARSDPWHREILDVVDPMYACEAFCFGGTRNACTCAGCYGVRACHPLCASEPSCVTRDDTIPSLVLTSESVAASCEPSLPLIGTRTWHTDMMACRSSGCDDCRSWSVSCDPTCQ